jgi:DNA processing protein
MAGSNRVLVPTPEQAATGCLAAHLGRPKAFAALVRHGSAQRALSILLGNRRQSDEIRTLMAQCERCQVSIMTYFEEPFPAALRHIPDPPLALYIRGQRACLNRLSVAVVGARRCSRTGAELAGELAGELLRGGLTVVSGLARGIDAAAHRGALAALLDGRADSHSDDQKEAGANTVAVMANTVAVMGAGLDSIYPRANTQLASALLEAGGTQVSEYSPTVPPAKFRFPERNRLISGLSKGVVIVEAGERSGSLITARFALEQGREVMAVPGAVGSGFSSGCHRMLREGAALVEGPQDVFEILGSPMLVSSAQVGERAPPAVPSGLVAVLAAVEPVATTLDEIVVATGIGAAEVAAKLLELELAGFVRQLAQGYIRRPFSATKSPSSSRSG